MSNPEGHNQPPEHLPQVRGGVESGAERPSFLQNTVRDEIDWFEKDGLLSDRLKIKLAEFRDSSPDDLKKFLEMLLQLFQDVKDALAISTPESFDMEHSRIDRPLDAVKAAARGEWPKVLECLSQEKNEAVYELFNDTKEIVDNLPDMYGREQVVEEAFRKISAIYFTKAPASAPEWEAILPDIDAAVEVLTEVWTSLNIGDSLYRPLQTLLLKFRNAQKAISNYVLAWRVI